jgi:hypothetical protein
MTPKLLGGWLLSVLIAAGGGYWLAQAPASTAAPPESALLARFERQEARLEALEAQFRGLDIHVMALGRQSPVVCPAPSAPVPVQALAGPSEEDAQERKATQERDAATPEGLALASRGMAVVESALGARRWRESDAQELRSMLPQMPPAQREEVLKKLITAVNEGRLVAEQRGPLF